jgi:ATP-binding cassette subfamily C (CFTR/MRP) protein 1
MVLSYFQHEFAVRPSSIILVYLLATGLIDIVVTWRLLLNSGDITGFAGYNLIAIMATKLVLFLLENQSKEPFLMHQYQGLSPESYSGLLNRSFLWWLNSLILNTSKRRLSTSDLFGLDDNLKSDNLRLRMGKCWKERSTDINLPSKVRSLIMF